MKMRARVLAINLLTLIFAVVLAVYLRYPHVIEDEGISGLWLFVITMIFVGTASAVIRTALFELFIVRRTAEVVSEEARFKASMSNLTLGFIMTDSQNNIVLINDRARHIINDGAPKPKDHLWTMSELCERLSPHFDLLANLKRSLKNHRSAEYADVEYHDRILRILVSPILNVPNQDAGCVIILEDVTEQKVLERMRDEFFSIASHELRTPLTAIRGNTAMIKQFYEPKVNDSSFTEMVDDIHDASVRLIKIVNDFLDASRLEQGKIKFKIEPFQLDSILESVAYETTNLAAEKANHIVVDKTLKAMPEVYADKDRTKQIIYNLVGNAMKFTDHGTITLRGQKEHGMLRVMVSDTGPGISEEDQQLLFRKFQQVGTSAFTRETSRGTGLGLYISKLLVEKMGGRIGLQSSELGKGTTFFFTVPLAKK